MKIFKNIKVYDNGGKTIDRYTVIYLDLKENNNCYSAVAMDNNPFSPQGFGQHVIARLGRHNGKLIRFDQLPDDCKKLVLSDLKDIVDNSTNFGL